MSKTTNSNPLSRTQKQYIIQKSTINIKKMIGKLQEAAMTDPRKDAFAVTAKTIIKNLEKHGM